MVTNLFCFIEVCDTPASKLFVLVYVVSMVLTFAYLPKGKQKKSTKKAQTEKAG